MPLLSEQSLNAYSDAMQAPARQQSHRVLIKSSDRFWQKPRWQEKRHQQQHFENHSVPPQLAVKSANLWERCLYEMLNHHKHEKMSALTRSKQEILQRCMDNVLGRRSQWEFFSRALMQRDNLYQQRLTLQLKQL